MRFSSSFIEGYTCMKERLEKRLTELKAEFESGQKMLADLETRQTTLRETLLRISGAIQVLEEELAKLDGQSSAAESRKPEDQAPGAGPLAAS
jgi:predicted nuclease with TOPRIM domain